MVLNRKRGDIAPLPRNIWGKSIEDRGKAIIVPVLEIGGIDSVLEWKDNRGEPSILTLRSER